MRNFKFRAWDPDMKEMLQVSQLWLDPKAHQWGVGILDQRNDFHKMDNITLMQFTGLKDRNGGDIYEGDILKHEGVEIVEASWTDNLDSGPLGMEKIFVEYYEVQWAHAHAGFALRPLDGGRMIFDMDSFHEIDIVGNIFENPELLKEI